MVTAVFYLSVLTASFVSGGKTQVREDNLNITQLLGVWYDVARTTYIWGPNTWTSEKWNFIQGRDGTVVTLFGGRCTTCGDCSSTYVYSVQRARGENSYVLTGHGETISFEVKAVRPSKILVSICFDGAVLPDDCRKDRLQVSVLSRDRTLSLEDWEDIVHVLPVSLAELDTTAEIEDLCPPLFIEEKFVTSRLMRSETAAVFSVAAAQGTTVLLNCTLRADDPADKLAYVTWVQDTSRQLLTYYLERQTDDFRFTGLRTRPRTWNLRINSISQADSDVYVCYTRNIPVTKVVLSTTVPPAITKTVVRVSAVKGQVALLECHASGYPRPTITWLRRLGTEEGMEIWETVGWGERLRLQNVQPQNSGVYQCLVHNGFGPKVRAYVTVQVDSAPEVSISEPQVFAAFGQSTRLLCQMPPYLHARAVWLRHGDVVRTGMNHVVELLRKNQLVLTVRRTLKEDFGEYVCQATNQLGNSSARAFVRESWPSGWKCRVDNIPVMNNFNIIRFLGEWERLQTTRDLWGEKTYLSEVIGFFTTFNGSLLQYYRGYSPQMERCLEPSLTSVISLDKPGDFLVSAGGQYGRYKVVYTDYTHAVLYYCLGGDDQSVCPRRQLHVQIVSRQQVIPDDVLQLLYTYVIKACVPVSELTETVAGLCKVPPIFLKGHGYKGYLAERTCKVDSLQVPQDFDVSAVTGAWQLVATARSDNNSAPYRSSSRIVLSGGDIMIFYRSYNATLDLCGPVQVDLLRSFSSPGRYTLGFGGLTAHSSVLFVDADSLVLYTCLHVQENGICSEDSHLVEVYSRSGAISAQRLLALKRPVINACVDITRLQRNENGNCTVQASLESVVSAEEIETSPTLIGCRRDLVPVANDFDQKKFVGQWKTIRRTTFDIQDVSDFSKVTHVAQAPDGTLQLLIRYYNSTVWRRCPPTEVLRLFQESAPGDYSFVYLSNTGAFKVLYLDDEVAVVYWCHHFLQSSLCSTRSLVVEILARADHSSISDDKLRLLQQHVVNVCVDLQHVKATTEELLCTIPSRVQELVEEGQVTSAYDIPAFACDGQHLKGDETVDIEKLTGKWNVMWRTRSIWDEQIPESESFFIILTYTGLLTLWRSYDNELKMCKPTEAGKLVSTSGPGDYYSSFDGWPEVMKVVYTDYDHLLALWCTLDEQAECFPDRISVEILSRNSNIDDVTRAELLSHLNLPCVDVSTVEATQGGPCSIRSDVITAAYISSIPVDYSVIGCRNDLIKGQHGVTDDLIVGGWTSIIQSKRTFASSPSVQTTFYFTKLPDRNISVLYRHYSEEAEECLPANIMTLKRDETYGTSFLTGQGGVLKVLYADPTLLAMLICETFLKDGTCDPETQEFFVLQRHGAHREITEELRHNMTVVAAGACVTSESLKQLWEEACLIPADILRDAMTGDLNEDYMQVQCQMQYIPVQENFDHREFAGTWYSHWDTQIAWGNKTWLSPAYHIAFRSNGTALLLYTALFPLTRNCLPTELRVLHPGTKPGSFTFDYNDEKALLKVVWTDYDQAVVYWCYKVRPNNLCDEDHVHVNVWWRRDEAMLSIPFDLLSLIADTCVSRQDFISTSSDLCEIPEDIIKAAQDENRKVVGSFVVIQCIQDFISNLESFATEQFSGVWHTVRQSKFMWGNATWDSLVRNFVVGADGNLSVAYTGYHQSQEVCLPAEVITFHPTGRAGQWTYAASDGQTVTVQVIWTDYTTAALLHTCAQVGEDGLCPRSSLQVEFLSRTPVATQQVVEKLSELLPGLCVQRSAVVEIRTDLCHIPTVVVDAVNMNRVGGTEASRLSCKTEDIPLDKRFTLVQMRGTWYEVARTRFTFNAMESAISIYEFDPHDSHLEGIFAGTMDKQCQSPVRSLTKNKSIDGPAAVITGRIQGPENIFPWITFYVMYYDGDYLMHLACYAETADGTCPRGKTEVTLLGRLRLLTPVMEEKLEGLMTSVCLSRHDLQLTKQIANCLPGLLAGGGREGVHNTSACRLNNVAVVENFDDLKLTGIWYGLRTRDFSAREEPHSFVVSVTRNNPETLKMRRWTVQNATCRMEKSVLLKPACKGSNSGDYISTQGSSFMLRWSSLKVLRFENSFVLLYWCVKETDNGACQPDGVRVDLLGRSKKPRSELLSRVLTSLSSVCLTANSLKTVPASDACMRTAWNRSPPVPLSPCSVDLLPAQTILPDQVSGLWYEVAHSVDPMFQLKESLAVYRALPENRLAMFLAAEGPGSQCQGPLQGSMKPRCHANPSGHMLGRLKIPGVTLWGPWQLLHVQANTSAIVFTCVDEQFDGSCSEQGTKLMFLARDPNPSPEFRQQLKAVVEQLGCFAGISIADTVHEGASCRSLLDPVMPPAV